MLVALLAVSPATRQAEAALEAAVECYEALDYACAETRLAEAMAGALTLPSLKRARLQEALLAIAHRDTARARRAVQALLALEPDHDPGPIPPPLREIFAEERATLPPPPAPFARADFTNIRLFGSDADRWSEGLGAEVAGGLLYQGAWAFEVAVGFSDHQPLTLVDEDLDLWTVAAGAAWRADVGPLRASVGLQLGGARVGIESSILADEAYWGLLGQVPVELSWTFWRGLGVAARVSPGVFFTSDQDRAAGSFVLPLLAGLRYGG